MTAEVLGCEFAKMRRLHVVLLAVVLLVVLTGMGLYGSVLTPDFDPTTEQAWNSLLGGIARGAALAAPLLVAVIASRQVDIEHQGSGWLMSATCGITPGGLCRAKFLATGSLVTVVTLAASGCLLGTGLLLGVSAPIPAGRWLGATLSILVVHLAVLALHVLIAARVENQLVGIGLGLLGMVLALFGDAVPVWMAHLTPWGYYALAMASGYVGDTLVALTPSYLSIAALGLVMGAVFMVLTRRFDRQEA